MIVDLRRIRRWARRCGNNSRGQSKLCFHSPGNAAFRANPPKPAPATRRSNDRSVLTDHAIVCDMLAHTVPKVLIVALMVSAIALMQSEGRYSYVTVEDIPAGCPIRERPHRERSLWATRLSVDVWR
jgi:hypothetical protein